MGFGWVLEVRYSLKGLYIDVFYNGSIAIRVLKDSRSSVTRVRERVLSGILYSTKGLYNKASIRVAEGLRCFCMV